MWKLESVLLGNNPIRIVYNKELLDCRGTRQRDLRDNPGEKPTTPELGPWY